MEATKSQKVLEYFYRERLCKRLVICLEDQVEKNRELSIEIIQGMVEKCGFKEESQIILPAIANRMIKTPYAEGCKFLRFSRIFLIFTPIYLMADNFII
jgi:hypothetical protein